MSTNIEWTDVTDNIIAVKGGGWWCRKLSPGCVNCYAEKLNKNAFYNGNMLAYSGKVPELILRRELCESWARQRKPKRHFVGSMTDIFGDWVEWEWIYFFLDCMVKAPRQTFQLLTKRPGVASNVIRQYLSDRGLKSLPANIWIGTSVENQRCADERIPKLLSIPAAVRFLSCEPLLGPVSLGMVNLGLGQAPSEPRIHWVIVGGESGSKARPMHRDWARDLRDQCRAADVPFLFKQWGEWGLSGDKDTHAVANDGTVYRMTDIAPDGPRRAEAMRAGHDKASLTCVYKVGKRVAGRLLDGREWNEFPRVQVTPEH